MQDYFLGIDIGTGSTKGVAVDANGTAVDVAQHYYPIKSPQPGYSEQDPQLILAAFLSCITDITKKAGHPPLAVSLSSAMHSLIPVDSNGKALTDMMTWADARSDQIAENLRATEQGKRIYRTCGTPIHSMAPLCKLIWLRENEKEIFESTYKFISIKEFIWYHLFGEFEIDHAIASATGLFDIEQLIWSREACDMAGISTAKLSAPVSNTYKRADIKKTLAISLGLVANTQFIIGASDGCCANLGSFVTEPGIASLTIGTSGAVRITSPKPVINADAMTFNYLLHDKTFVCGGAINNGGNVLDWLLKTVMDKKYPGHDDYDKMFGLITEIPAGSDGLIFLPYLYGERAPLWDIKTCGTFFNIKPQHTRGHFLRAGLEGICLALNDVLQTVEQSSALIERVHISGGFITSPVWTQVLADVTGKQLVIVQQEDASALGAVFLSMQALGYAMPEQPAIDERQIINPNQQYHQTYKKTYLLFKRLYKDLKDTMHWLHGE